MKTRYGRALEVEYTKPEDVRKALIARRELRTEVERFWLKNGWGRPPLPDVPLMAVLARQIGTWRGEDVAFYRLAKAAGLTPCWLDYSADKFSTQSSYKRSLLKRYLLSGYGRAGGPKIEVERLVPNINALMGHRLDSIVTNNGQSLLDFHRQLQQQMCPEAIRAEMSPWMLQFPGGAKGYYVACLSWYIAHGVLFEDFSSGESGRELLQFLSIFDPAYFEVSMIFGVRPLIVKMPLWTPEQAYYPTVGMSETDITKMLVKSA